jgi:hypothetical protein
MNLLPINRPHLLHQERVSGQGRSAYCKAPIARQAPTRPDLRIAVRAGLRQ